MSRYDELVHIVVVRVPAAGQPDGMRKIFNCGKQKAKKKKKRRKKRERKKKENLKVVIVRV